MLNPHRSHHFYQAGLLSILVGLCPVAFAQEEVALPSPAPEAAEASPVPPPSSHDNGKKTERISVIGSRIKRSTVETSSPTVTISRKQIEESGVATVGEILRGQATASTGNFSGSSGYVRTGAQTGDLYGLGSGRTLVLVDGERLPRDASLSGTNLSLIPSAMVERVEILSGSKSAVYGSDAVAGVINIVTRKDFEGNEFKTSIRVPQHGGGETQSASIASGVAVGDGGNLVLAAGVAHSNRLYQKNRDISYGEGKFAFGQFAQPRGAYNYRLVDSASFRPVTGASGLWQPSANCPAGSSNDQRGPGEPDRGIFCVGNLKKNASDELMPESENGFVTGKLLLDVGSLGRLTGFAAYTRSHAEAISGNYFGNANYLSPGRRTIISAARAGALGIDTGGNALEFYQLDDAAPIRVTSNVDQSYGGFLALSKEYASGWTSNVSLTRYTTQNARKVSNTINRERYAQLISGYTKNPDGSVTQTANPDYVSLDPNRDTSVLGSIVDDLRAKEVNTLTSISANAGHDLFALPGGKAAFNIGLDLRSEEFKQTPDARDTLFWQNMPLYTGTEGTSGSGDRSVASLYAELLLPVATSLNVDFALRYDSYSDVGDATTFNLGGKYDVTDSFALRANTGSSFRAPELNYVHQKGGGGYVSIRDDKWCDARNAQGVPCVAGETHQVFVDRPGNKDLTPERARSYVLGAIYEPNNDFYVSADYVAFTITNVFNLRPAQDVVDDINAGRPTGASSANFDPVYNYITSLRNPWLNIGIQRIYLIKGELSYKHRLGPVGLSYLSENTRTISRREEQTDGEMKQLNGIEGYPKWRWTQRFSGTYEGYTTTLLTSTTSQQTPDPDNLDTYKPTYFNEKVPEYTRYDLSVSKTFPSQTEVTLGIINLADKIGGLYRTGNFTGAESTSGALYAESWNGRTFFANLTQNF